MVEQAVSQVVGALSSPPMSAAGPRCPNLTGAGPADRRGPGAHGSGVRLSDLVNLCTLPAWSRSLISPGDQYHSGHTPDHEQPG